LTTRRRLTIRGRVQGVGFRWFVREAAVGLGLVGWVRNRQDGGVEAEAEGESSALARFAAELRNGHPYARVDGVEEVSVPPQGERSFDIR
jgi:acylphosphatase